VEDGSEERGTGIRKNYNSHRELVKIGGHGRNQFKGRLSTEKGGLKKLSKGKVNSKGVIGGRQSQPIEMSED